MVDFKVGSVDVSGSCRRIGEYWYNKDSDTLYYSLPYPFPLAFSVQGIASEVVRVRATPWFMRLPTVVKFHNVDFLLQQLLQVQLLKKDKVMVHGAGWQEKGVGYLAVGFPNSGKTTRVLEALEKGHKICADENIILADGVMYPVMRQSALSLWQVKRFKIKLSTKQKWILRGRVVRSAILPYLFDPIVGVNLPGPRHSIKLNKIIWLTDGDGKSLITLTENEFPWQTNPVLQAYSYATGWDMNKLVIKQRRLLEEVQRVHA